MSVFFIFKDVLLSLSKYMPSFLAKILMVIGFIGRSIPLFGQMPTPKKQRYLRLWFGGLSISLIGIGLILTEYKAIYDNAIILCLSCIGIK